MVVHGDNAIHTNLTILILIFLLEPQIASFASVECLAIQYRMQYQQRPHEPLAAVLAFDYCKEAVLFVGFDLRFSSKVLTVL